MPASHGPPLGEGPDETEEDWEDILSLRVESDTEEPPRRPVRLSSLRPPVTGVPQDQMAPGPVPLAPGERWDAGPHRSSQTQIEELEREHERLRERANEALRRLEESEDARRASEARVAELDRELGDLQAQIAYEREAATRAGPAGADRAQVERLRNELAAAQEIIRAIEETYLAAEGRSRRFRRQE